MEGGSLPIVKEVSPEKRVETLRRGGGFLPSRKAEKGLGHRDTRSGCRNKGSGCVFGAVTKAINRNRGKDGGFWWGFFLGIIGIIIVAVRPKE